MKKRSFILLMLLIALMSLTGCSTDSMFEKEYMNVSQHPEVLDGDSSEKEIIAEVSNYDELKAAYINMIRDYMEFGVIQLVDYEGDPAFEVPDACTEVSYGTSLGIFAVYYMNASIVQSDLFTEVEVTINYNKSIRQIKNLSYADTREDVDAVIYKCIQDASSYAAFYTQLDDINQEYVANLAEKYYYSDATLAVFAPITTTAVYAGFDDEVIVEINFARQYSINTIVDMKYEVLRAAKKYLNSFQEGHTGEWLLESCEKLADSVEYIKEKNIYDKTKIEYTAYSALVDGRATSEGFAMAYKMICDLNGVECLTVIGNKNNERHCWNIINLDGQYYHVDVSAVKEHGAYRVFLKNDDTIEAEYEWDTQKYPKCEGTATYYDFLNVIQY